MHASRVLPVLAATAAVLVASTAASGANPADGATQDPPGHGVATAAPAQDPSPVVLLFATPDPQRLTKLRVEVCTLADSPDAGRTAFKIDVKTPEEPVDATCLNAAVPAPPETADTPARRGLDREPATAADQDYGAVTVTRVRLSDLKLGVCDTPGPIVPIMLSMKGDPDKDCRDILVNG